jgi:hypothetical protein
MGCKKYVSEFRQNEVFVPEVDEATKTALFLRGLRGYPDLYRVCATQPNGEPWTELNTLMDYALAKDAALRVADKGVKRPAASLAVAVAEEPEEHEPEGKDGTGAMAAARRDGRQDGRDSKRDGRKRERSRDGRDRERRERSRDGRRESRRDSSDSENERGRRAQFTGTCHNCNMTGHRWLQCRKPLSKELEALKAAQEAAGFGRRR